MADQHQNQQGQNAAGGGQQAQLKVTVPDEIKKGVYSNAVSVNVNTNEFVADFGYLLPNTANPEIEVVTRVNMNHKTAESFLNVMSGALEDFKKKQAAQAAQPAAATSAPAPSPVPTPAPAAPVAPVTPVPAAPVTPPQPGPPMPPLPENA